MNLNWKSLSFYGVAIGSVLMLFKVVTAYGESNLKASPAIGDRYRLTVDPKFTQLRKPEGLMLNIQQSGVYINGYLSLANTNAKVSTATAPKPTLIGRLSNQKLNLSGKISKISCVIELLPRIILLPVSPCKCNCLINPMLQVRCQ